MKKVFQSIVVLLLLGSACLASLDYDPLQNGPELESTEDGSSEVTLEVSPTGFEIRSLAEFFDGLDCVEQGSMEACEAVGRKPIYAAFVSFSEPVGHASHWAWFTPLPPSSNITGRLLSFVWKKKGYYKYWNNLSPETKKIFTALETQGEIFAGRLVVGSPTDDGAFDKLIIDPQRLTHEQFEAFVRLPIFLESAQIWDAARQKFRSILLSSLLERERRINKCNPCFVGVTIICVILFLGYVAIFSVIVIGPH